MSLIFYIILLQLIIVSWVDIKTTKIKNYWFLGNSLLGIVLQLTLYHFDWQFIIYPLATILIGLILFEFKIMGAGDSKYMASLFLLAPASSHHLLLISFIESTIVVGIMMLLMGIMRKHQEFWTCLRLRDIKGIISLVRSRFSYAPVMLIGWLLWGVKNEFSF